MGVNAVIAAFYYLAVVRRMFFAPAESTDPVEVPGLLRVAMGLAAVALFVVFAYPPLITDPAEKATLVPVESSTGQEVSGAGE
jgi:NADH:ubiquinone oxidoreductase subunit 2 (subunit N)